MSIKVECAGRSTQKPPKTSAPDLETWISASFSLATVSIDASSRVRLFSPLWVAMLHSRQNLFFSCSIAFELIRHHHPWGKSMLFKKLFYELLGCRQVRSGSAWGHLVDCQDLIDISEKCQFGSLTGFQWDIYQQWSMTFLTINQAFHNFLGKNQQKNAQINYFYPPLLPVLFGKIKAPTRNLTNPEIVKVTCSYFWVLIRNLSQATLNILTRRITCSNKIRSVES